MPVRERWWSVYLHGALAALMLCMPTIINNSPLFYEDSGSYIARAVGPVRALGGDFRFGREWILARSEARQAAAESSGVQKAAPAEKQASSESRLWPAGRSIYYGIATYLAAAIGGLGLAVALQGLLVGTAIALLWVRCLDLRPLWLPPAALALAFLTSAGVFVGLIMPDVLTALVVLIPPMLVFFWRRLFVLDRIVLAALLIYATIGHDSHIVLLASILAALAVALAFRPARPAVAKPALALVAGALTLGVGALLAYNAMAIQFTGKPVARLPFISAHLASLDVGVDYLKSECPQAGLELCDHVDRLPMSWTDFMFEETSFYVSGDEATRGRLRVEQMRFALGVLADRPVLTILTFAGEALRQTAMFSYYDLDQTAKTYFWTGSLTPGAVQGIADSRLFGSSDDLRVWSMVQQIVFFVSAACLILLAVQLYRRDGASDRLLLMFAGYVVGGVLLNGVICGILASPYDRFQARVAWLVPFVAITGLACLYRERKTRQFALKGALSSGISTS